RQRRQALLRFRQRGGEELAFGPVQLQRKGELVPALPRVFRQQGRAGGEIGERRRIGGGRLRALARDRAGPHRLLAFFFFGDQRGALVELIDDLEDPLPPPLRRRVRRQQAAD